MKKVIAMFMAVFCLAVSIPAWAQTDSKKGASEQAYEHASENAVFNRISDWFATIGKSEEEKAKILSQRKAERAAKRAAKEAERVQREAQQGIKTSQESAEKTRQKAQKQIQETNSQPEAFLKGPDNKGKNK